MATDPVAADGGSWVCGRRLTALAWAASSSNRVSELKSKMSVEAGGRRRACVGEGPGAKAPWPRCVAADSSFESKRRLWISLSNRVSKYDTFDANISSYVPSLTFLVHSCHRHFPTSTRDCPMSHHQANLLHENQTVTPCVVTTPTSQMIDTNQRCNLLFKATKRPTCAV